MTDSKKIVELLRDRSVIGVDLEIAAANHIEAQDKQIAELETQVLLKHKAYLGGTEKITELQAVVDRIIEYVEDAIEGDAPVTADAMALYEIAKQHATP